MVRKKYAAQNQRIGISSSGGALEALVEFWLQQIRERLPDGGTAVVTIHKVSRRRFLVSFRASAFGETFISEVREESLEEGVRLAGSHLFERLEQNPPQPQEKLRERFFRFFGEEREAV